MSPMSKKRKDFLKRIWNEWIVTLAIAFALALFFRTVFYAPRHIPSGSMIPTIKIGEFIFVKMFAYDWHIPYTRWSLMKRGDPHRGDIIVFEYPDNPDLDFIKRVVAVPGDEIEVRDRRIIVNGVPYPTTEAADTSILNDLAPKYDPKRMALFEEQIGDVTHYFARIFGKGEELANKPVVKVPENMYFTMGDNRDDSSDSRAWGFVPREKILGQASFIWFSFDIDNPPWLRFSRFFTLLK